MGKAVAMEPHDRFPAASRSRQGGRKRAALCARNLERRDVAEFTQFPRGRRLLQTIIGHNVAGTVKSWPEETVLAFWSRDGLSSPDIRETNISSQPGDRMPRVSAFPYSAMDPELKAIVRASDEALNGSEWVQYFCHPTELYKSFVKFYYDHIATEEYGISWKLSEMMRHMVAVHNTCSL